MTCQKRTENGTEATCDHRASVSLSGEEVIDYAKSYLYCPKCGEKL